MIVRSAMNKTEGVVTIQIEPPAVQRKKSRTYLTVVLDQLEAVVQVLRSLAPNPRANVELVRANMNSPAVFETRAIGDNGRMLSSTARLLGQTLAALESGRKLPKSLPSDALVPLMRLARESVDGYRVTISVGDDRFQIGPQILKEIEASVGSRSYEKGEFVGELLRINLRDTSRLFYIYPKFGPSRIACRFQSGLRQDIEAVTGKMVRVVGTLCYTSHSPFPYEIVAERVEEVKAAQSDAFLKLLKSLEAQLESGALHQLPQPHNL
jgi:hypothetical protein